MGDFSLDFLVSNKIALLSSLSMYANAQYPSLTFITNTTLS